MKIKKQLVKSRAKTFAGTNPRRFITIHETANTSRGADAQAHANLQSRGFSASWHWTVDDKQAIQSFPHTVRCWHAGDGRGHGNMSSIGIEICVNSDGDYDQAVANAAELVRKIMGEENIPLDRVVQHNHWSGKNCPTNLRKGSNWREFISQIAQTTAPTKPKPTPSKPSTGKGKMVGPGYDFPLPKGYYFGPRTQGARSRSGYYPRTFNGKTDRQWLIEFGKQLARRGWNVGKGKTWLSKFGNNGFYGNEYNALIKKFQENMGLRANGALGIDTWNKAFKEPIK